MKAHKSDEVIGCYSLEGKLIRTYKSAKEASVSIGVFYRTIDKAIREKKIIHNKQWLKVDKNNVPDSIKPYVKTTTVISIRPLALIDESNKVISTYPSVKKASENNHVDPHTIRDVLSGKTKSANGKKYRYLNEDEIIQYGYTKGHEINIEKVGVIQLDSSGKYIKSYKSISEASKALGKENGSQLIRECLSGKYSTAFGYVWKYKDKDNIKRKKKPMIIQIDKDSKRIIGKYKTVKEASDITKISTSSINNCLSNKSKSAGSFIWKRK